MQRFLDPAVLARISGLDLVAKTVVDGFVAGLHRSPDFGFSQEFAEYRAYSPGDDLRHVDWNVFARTERAYLKRYRGETNSLLTVLLDASNSMNYTSHGVNKMDYARFIAASLFYLAIQNQRDAAGLIVFDDEVRNYIRPSTRQGQLHRLLSGLELAEPARARISPSLSTIFRISRRRGLVVIISDFYESPEKIVRTIEPLRFHGNEVILFHVLDPKEIRPRSRRARHPGRSRNPGAHGSDARIRHERIPRRRWTRTSRNCASARRAPEWITSCSSPIGRSMALCANILRSARGEIEWASCSMVSGAARWRSGVPLYLHLLRQHTTDPRPFSSLMFFEQRTQSSIRHRRLRYLVLLSLRLALLLFVVLAFANPFINRSARQHVKRQTADGGGR